MSRLRHVTHSSRAPEIFSPQDLEESRARTLNRLALAAEYDDDTFKHTERVGETAARIAGELGLEERAVRRVREAAPLHDLGKLAIPDRILLKPGRLTSEEFEVMTTHTTLGARLLRGSRSPVLRMATVIALTHHERWDGGGYPRGLSGEAIPIAVRIVAVADVFDALTHDRPYKSAWPVAQAIAEIRRSAGTHFDPRVVDAFLATRHRRVPRATRPRRRAGAAVGLHRRPMAAPRG